MSATENLMSLIVSERQAQQYNRIQDIFQQALVDLSILNGDILGILGPSDATWQDVAGTAACNLRVVADYLDKHRTGAAFSVQFPNLDYLQLTGDQLRRLENGEK